MSSKSLTSKGSFRTMGSFREKEKETPEERYKRLEMKYGRALHDAVAKKDQLRKDRKVNNWMEVFVLLNEQHPRKIVSPTNIKTPNGNVDPLLAAGIVRDPEEQFMKRLAARSSSAPSSPTNRMVISKEDRQRVNEWLSEEIASEQKKLEDMTRSERKPEEDLKEQRARVENLQQQVEDLQAFEEAAQGQAMTIHFTGQSMFDQRVKRETTIAAFVACMALVLMFIIMHFLD